MREFTSIVVPDGVTLDFPVAGPLSRLLAYAADLVITGIIYLLMALSVGAVGVLGGEWTRSAVVAILILFFFIVQWGYFVAFELAWSGQTPGKRLAGLRVIADDGRHVEWRRVVLRNLLRAVDMWPPPFYAVGAITGLVHPRGKRLGDVVAETFVVHDDLDLEALEHQLESGAKWAAKVGRGESRAALLLPGGALALRELVVVQEFLRREAELELDRKERVAVAIARPLLRLFNEDVEAWERSPSRFERSMRLLREIDRRAASVEDHRADAAESRRDSWMEFGRACRRLERSGRAAFQGLDAEQIDELMQQYHVVLADLSRARGLGADPGTIRVLNRLAVSGHLLLRARRATPPGALDPWSFGATVVRCRRHVALAAALLTISGVVAFAAVQQSAQLAFDLVPLEFQRFRPAGAESMHDIPSLTRPVAASAIITNNLQVTFLAFALGMTAGLGTIFLLCFNGAHIGATAGWFFSRSMSLPFWGFVAPHGVTELLAIALAGGAGLRLAEALVFPGQSTRRWALADASRDGLEIILGCMVMLGIAGLIEGFVSGSSIPLGARWTIALASAGAWGLYFGISPRRVRS
jgi:uncharacterized membrane protein SpoIIM required for sporulation